MKELVVRAGKYFSVSILLISCLPVLVPLFFILSVFGCAFLLPLGCALAGFLYLRKYVGMLYRKLPFTIGCSSWGRPPSAGGRPVPPLFIDLPLRDQQAIETFESVDPEFDAVVISTAPREVERGSIIDDIDDADIGSEVGAVPFADVCADEASKIEGIDDDSNVENAIRKERSNDDPCVVSGTRREGTDDDMSANEGHGREGTHDDTSAENGTRKEGIDAHAFVEIGTIAGETDNDTPDENGTRSEVRGDSTSPDDGTRKERINEDTCDEVRNRTEGMDEDTSNDEIGGDVRDVGKSTKDGNRTEEKDSASIEYGTGREGNYDYGQMQEEEKEEEDEQRIEAENLHKEKTEKNAIVHSNRDDNFHTMSSGTNHEKSFEALENNERTSGDEEIEENRKQDEFQAKPDASGHPEVDEEQEGPDKRADAALEESEEQEIETLPRECMLGEFGEDQDRKSALSAAAAISHSTFHEASEKEVPTKTDGVGNLLPHQANEDDIWICKECGWKYPNAKPSAKIRRNHKKHCKGSSPRAQSPEDETNTESPSQHKDEFEKLRMDSKSTCLPADSTQKQVEEEMVEGASNAEPDVEGDKFIGAVKAEDLSTEPSARGTGATTIPPEQRSSPTNNLHTDVIQVDSGSLKEGPSSPLAGERIHEWSSRAQDDVISPDHEHDPHSKGLDFEVGGVARSPGQSLRHDEESGLECDSFRSVANEFPSITSESFRSVPDEFPHDRWSSFRSAESRYDDEEDQLAQVQQELQLCDDLNAMKGVVGDKHVSTGPLLTDIEELSVFLGIDLPVRSTDLPEIEWAKLAIEVMKVVVGID